MKIKIAPSILSADFGKLSEEIKSVEPYSDIIHVDVMDGHFVPNISFGAPVTKWIKSDLPQDVHLMISEPEKYLEDFVKASGAGARLIVHQEACGDGLRAVLEKIRELGAGAGVSIKPGTGVDAIKDVLDIVDIVLIMTVEPGFSGQSFMADMLPKCGELRDLGYEGDICIDGGVKGENAKACIDAGANVLVSASYVFGAEDRVAALKSLRG